MLAPHLLQFCDEWVNKANKCDENNVSGCYDKFFTLFVVFNRLYAEATFELARRGKITLQPNRPLPDRKGATEYTLSFIGQHVFDQLLDNQLTEPVATLVQLIEDERFYIKLSSPNGDRQRDMDLELLLKLRSQGKTRALAILDLIYSVRCNLFHGHKAFQPVQVELLRPTIRVVLEVIYALRRSHDENA